MSSNRMIHSVCASQENKYGKKYNPKGMKREFVATFGWIIARSIAFTLHEFSNLSGLIPAEVKCTKILILEANKMHYFSTLFDKKNSTCFGQTYCPSSGVLILYSQQ